MVLFLILDIGGDVREVDKKITASFKLDDTIALTSIKGIIQNKGKSKIERLVIWHDNEIDIHVYGFKSGTKELINRHCPPKPLDNIELFGDILMIASHNNEIIDMNETMYLDLFNEMLENEEDILPDEAEIVEDEIVYDFNSEGSADHIIDIVEADDDEITINTVEINYEIELDFEPEFIGKLSD